MIGRRRKKAVGAVPERAQRSEEIRVYLTKRVVVSDTSEIQGFTILGKTYLFEEKFI